MNYNTVHIFAKDVTFLWIINAPTVFGPGKESRSTSENQMEHCLFGFEPRMNLANILFFIPIVNEKKLNNNLSKKGAIYDKSKSQPEKKCVPRCPRC